MPLIIEDDDREESIFPHNRDFSEGVRERGIREGQATIVVALDGSGDAETIQEGINMLPTTGGVVYIKEGTYVQKLDTAITMGANIQLRGTGKATIIKADAGSASTMITLGANCSLVDLYIDGRNLDNAGVTIASTDCFIVNCYFVDCNDNSINLNSSKARILNNSMSSGNHGITLTGATECIIIGNNIFSNAGGARGIYIINTSDNNIIMGNVIVSNGNDGIELEATSDNNIIEGNIIKSNGAVGIHIAAASDDKNLIHGNIVLLNTTAQITDSGTATTVADNITA